MKVWVVRYNDITVDVNGGELILGVFDAVHKAISYADSLHKVPPYITVTSVKTTKDDEGGNIIEQDVFYERKYNKNGRRFIVEIMPYVLNER